MEIKKDVTYTDGSMEVVVLRTTDKMVFFRDSAEPKPFVAVKEQRMMKDTFTSRFYEKPGFKEPVKKFEVTTPEPAMTIRAATAEEAIQFAASKVEQRVGRIKRAPLSERAHSKVEALKAKWEKKFRKDLRYGSRKAKVEAKRALGL